MQKTLLAVSLGLIAALPARAEAEMATDDAGTLAVGGIKVEAVLVSDDQTRGGDLAFGFGLIKNVEVELSFARATDRANDPSTRLRGTGVGIKWVPIQSEPGWSLGLGLGYGRTRVNERATSDKFTETGYSLSGLATYRFESGQELHMNLGSARVESQGDSDSVATWGIGFEFPLLEKWQLTVEAFGQEHARPDRAIGLCYEVFEGFKFSGAIGRGNDRGFGQIGVAWEF